MSYGQELLRRYIVLMSDIRFIENYRPEWLFGMELDFYFPDKRYAVEFNGDQHYIKTTYGTPDSQIRRDGLKKRICKEKGITLRILDASDLEYTRVRSKTKGITSKSKTKKNIKELRMLNKDGIEYRKILIRKYDSPTAHRKSLTRHLLITSKR